MLRLESAVRAAERMIQVGRENRPPVFSGLLGEAGSFPFPTSRMTIPPIPYNGDTVDILLTRDDRNKIIWWDQYVAQAAPYYDGGDRIFHLPPDPVVNDTFWFFLHVSNISGIRFSSLDHSVAGPQHSYFGTLYLDYPFQNYMHSSWFNPEMKRYERDGLVIYGMSGYPTNPISVIVIRYVGGSVSRPISYRDLDGDTYFNADAGDDEPLDWGDATTWAVLYESNTPGNRSFVDPWWYSYDPWPVERHT